MNNNYLLKILRPYTGQSIDYVHRCLSHIVLLILFGLCTSASLADDTEIYTGLDQTQCTASAESYRFVFIVDNSGSMSGTEFSQSRDTVNAAIAAVLNGNLGDVEVAVMQYGTNNSSHEHFYDISVPFTTDLSTATNWNRVFGPGSDRPSDLQDHLPGSLAEARNDNIYSAGGALDITDGTNVQFVFFTDAWEYFSDSACCSTTFGPASDPFRGSAYVGFGEYNRLKNGSVLPNGVKAEFTVLNVNSRAEAKRASAAIASVGGEYTGDVEPNLGDPQGSGTKPRRFISTSLSDPDLAAKLVELVEEVIEEIRNSAFTQSAPAVTVNAFNQLVNRNELYYSLFSPELSPRWDGNIKGYTIDEDSKIIDREGNDAIDPDTGSLKDEAQSFWSVDNYPECDNSDDDEALVGCTVSSDGSAAAVGAFRDNLTKARTVYTQSRATQTEYFPEDDGSGSGGDGNYFGDGLLKINGNSEIDQRLLGLDDTEDDISDGEVDIHYSVISGDSFTYSEPSNTLFFDVDAGSTDSWSALAQGDSIAALDVDTNKAWVFEFTTGIADGDGTTGADRISIGLNNPEDTAFTNWKRVSLGFFFTANNKYRTIRDQSRSSATNFSVGDVFSLEYDGIDTYIFKRNGIVIDSTSSPIDWSGNAIASGSNFTPTVVGLERSNVGSGDFVAFSNSKILQETIDIGPGPIDSPGLTREDVLSWLIGVDINGERENGDIEGNRYVSDSLHSRPRVITYGGEETAPLDVLFHSTNMGMLHAIDPDKNTGGKELWAYIPAELLKNPTIYLREDETITQHQYGLDGQLSSWVIRPSRTAPGIVESPLQVFLYMGQRRGGKGIYAFNATNAAKEISGFSAPSDANTCDKIGDGTSDDPVCQLFRPIIGGTDLNSTPGFEMLGQTWGKPTRIKVNTSDAGFCASIDESVPCQRDLVLFSGGYDTQYDGVTQTCFDDRPTTGPNGLATVEDLRGCVVGNHLYMVDAFTGELVWSIGNTEPNTDDGIFVDCEYNPTADDSVIAAGSFGTCNDIMEHSFVATPVTLDLDSDGAIDTIFANDISGKIWRIDLHKDENLDSSARLLNRVTSGIIADLSKYGTTAKNRFFYNSLDVSLQRGSDLEGATSSTRSRFMIVVGSGKRASPTAEVDPNQGNGYYIIFDENIVRAPDDYSYAGSSSSPSTTNLSDLGQYNGGTNVADLSPGGYVLLENSSHEKALSSTITVGGIAIGVSYLPATATENQCSLGNSKIYTINLRTGEVETFDLVQQGIVAEAVLLNLLDSGDEGTTTDDTIDRTFCFGTECFEGSELGIVDDNNLGKAVKTAWWEKLLNF